MEKIVIIGASGFGREVQWLIKRINDISETWNIWGYIDDGIEVDTYIDGYPVLGNVEYLNNLEEKIAVVCAVGNAKTRKKIIERIAQNENLSFPNIIDPSVKYSHRVTVGKGNIICADTIMTVDISIGNFNIINLDCTIGHDDIIKSFVTIYPSVNVSGNVQLNELCEIGTGTQIIQGLTVGAGTIVGAGAVVVRDLPEECTAVGSPAKPIKYHIQE